MEEVEWREYLEGPLSAWGILGPLSIIHMGVQLYKVHGSVHGALDPVLDWIHSICTWGNHAFMRAYNTADFFYSRIRGPGLIKIHITTIITYIQKDVRYLLNDHRLENRRIK